MMPSCRLLTSRLGPEALLQEGDQPPCVAAHRQMLRASTGATCEASVFRAIGWLQERLRWHPTFQLPRGRSDRRRPQRWPRSPVGFSPCGRWCCCLEEHHSRTHRVPHQSWRSFCWAWTQRVARRRQALWTWMLPGSGTLRLWMPSWLCFKIRRQRLHGLTAERQGHPAAALCRRTRLRILTSSRHCRSTQPMSLRWASCWDCWCCPP
mmetsp:Transcript_81029/g.146270  ORF Transcript_81029/g.146270 Transcript_81029/m.146270 type:complete len:208 (+) Transcript_81029:94-717(+)